MAQLISQEFIPKRRGVQLVFMDCFGSQQWTFVSLRSGPTVEEKTTSMLASMDPAEESMKAYLASQPEELERQLSSGAAAIAAAIAEAEAKGTTPPVTGPPVTTPPDTDPPTVS